MPHRRPPQSLRALSGSPLFIRSAGLPFSKPYFVDRVKTWLLKTRQNPSKYSGHSICKGATVCAIAAGLSEDEVRLLDRWKSDAVDIYINEVDQSPHQQRMLTLNTHFVSFVSSWQETKLDGLIPPTCGMCLGMRRLFHLCRSALSLPSH